MTQISNVDQVLLLLRSHLERTRKARKRDAKPSGAGRAAPPTALQRVEQLASTDALSDAELRKALVAGLLTEEFGAAITNDPNFQQVVGDVLAALTRDPDAAALLDAATAQLTGTGGV